MIKEKFNIVYYIIIINMIEMWLKSKMYMDMNID